MTFEGIDKVCAAISKVSDFCWEFPTNMDWYASIPVLGNFSFAILLLVGSGIFFTLRLRFVQIRTFPQGIRLLLSRREVHTGISPLAAFFLSTAMRVGPGNILGVTGAIATGGPGALLWMWVSAFFGMATAYVESTLSQIFKEKKGNEYVGGFAYYGKKLLHNSSFVGIALSLLYIVYALLCLPAQGFNTVSAVGQISYSLTLVRPSPDAAINWIACGVLIVIIVCVSFGGIRRTSRITNRAVPVMAVVYFVTVLILIVMNAGRIPDFFRDVFTGAFKPEAIFGGAFGTALAQGIKRGLMSNEAGQGTITMAAAASDARHPCDQGSIQSIGVFLDTMVICTLTAFVVVMGQQWKGDGAVEWIASGKLPCFISSAEALSGGGAFGRVVSAIMSLCFGLFAFTCLLGFVSFTEMCAARISDKRGLIISVRVLSLAVVSFGLFTSLAGLDLSALWNLSDFANILMVFANIPLLYLGLKHVLDAGRHF